MAEFTLGGKTVSRGDELPSRLSMMLWGPPGGGKTTLASTAPGKKLWINFDPDGPASIVGLQGQHEGSSIATALHNDIHVLDLSGEPNKVIDGFKRDDHLGLGKILADDTIGIDTVVVDSLTRVSQMALEHSLASGNHGRATIEKPGQSVYGGRNALTYRVVVDILTITKRYNKNVIFITHEGAPSTNDDGVVLFITMSLGGQLPNLSATQISEVWHVNDTGKERRILVRPARSLKPMKTRMFDITDGTEFVWKYDINKPDPAYEIATWWKEYQDGKGKKLKLPK
jgi:hypothetical protein